MSMFLLFFFSISINTISKEIRKAIEKQNSLTKEKRTGIALRYLFHNNLVKFI